MLTMEIKSKVYKFTGERKIVEIPPAVRDNFKIGEYVKIIKIKKNGTNPKIRPICKSAKM